jgi:diacylglycerol kinase (ATP)
MSDQSLEQGSGHAGQPRIVGAFFNSMAGLQWAFRREAAVREECIGLLLAIPVALVIAASPMMFAAMIGVILGLIAVELLNTAVEKLADHVAPYRHPAIGLAKDLGSAAVFMMLLLTGLVWLAAIAERLMAG